MSKYKIVIGNIVSPIDDNNANYYHQGCMLLEKGKSASGYIIKEIFNLSELKHKVSSHKDCELLDYSGQLILPSFCDIHFHWVQDDVREMNKDNLLDWLKNHTWPNEARFADENYTKEKSLSFSKSLINAGTLTGAVYGSIHAHSVDYAMQNFPGDFIAGNVLMTMNSPDELLQKKEEATELVRSLSQKYKNRYAVTPRFAITTHPDVMAETAKIGERHDSFIQTHLCETKPEIEFVMEIYSKLPGFEKVKSYTEVYEKCGLLGPKSIFGHGIYLTTDELQMLKKSSSSIAHCPSSNAPVASRGLGSGLFDIDLINKHRISWALASDIGAGPYLSMIDVMNSFVNQHQSAGRKHVNWTMALYRSTLAGEKICGNHQNRGNFAPGKEANFVVVRSEKIDSSWDVERVLQNSLQISASNRDDVTEKLSAVFWQGRKLSH